MTALQLRSPRGGGLNLRTAAALMATLLAAPALLSTAGCSGPGKPRIDLDQIDDSFRPALAELQNAINAHENETAGGILASIQARGPQGDAKAATERFAAVLRGRELEASLGLRLDTSADPDQPGHRRLLLISDSQATVPVTLQMEAALLRQRVVALAPSGEERIAAGSQTISALAGVTVPPAGEPGLELELLSYPLASRGAMAARDGWQLEVYPGTLQAEGSSYTSDRLVVQPSERVLLATELPKALLDEQPLIDYLSAEETFAFLGEEGPDEHVEQVFNPRLLERTVRIAEEHRTAAIEALSELAADLPDDRLTLIEPSLRWLLRLTEESYRPAEWRTLLDRAGVSTAGAGIEGLELRPIDVPAGDAEQ